MIFELRASKIHGVGVFTLEKIKKGNSLPLFEDGDSRFIKTGEIECSGLHSRLINKYSIQFTDGISAPKNFNRMSIGWYLNDSEDPNACHDANYDYFALRDIRKNEEITIDYDEL